MAELVAVLTPIITFQLSPILLPAAAEIVGWMYDQRSRSRPSSVATELL
jgi:hypothetical protein